MSFDAVLVHFGDPAPTQAAVARLSALAPASITVVDNSANLPALPAARILTPGQNLGFGSGVNLGATAGRAGWLLVLNPDAEITHSAVDALLADGHRHPGLGMLAPRLLHADGSDQVNGGRFSGWVRESSRCLGAGRRLRGLRAGLRRESRPGGEGQPISRPWVSAATVLVRRTAFEQVEGFDERFFLYYEDEDLCRRLRARGWQVVVCPRATARHAVGGSTGLADPYRSPHFETSRALYHRLHSGPALRALVTRDAHRRTARLLSEMG
ncbi:MAG: glycosyltransferase [Actinomycetota bacterium]|nr:glycosyltransferase [Actinomycetota bacterium]